jgi:hypothetical protein
MTLGPAFTVLIIFDRTSDRGGSTRDLFLGRPQLRHQAINVRELCGHHFGSDLGGRRRRRRRRRRGRRRRLGLGVLLKGPERGGIGSDEFLDMSVEWSPRILNRERCIGCLRVEST